jgi:hypothetical protein
MRSIFPKDPTLPVNAYLEGELDPANTHTIYQQMAIRYSLPNARGSRFAAAGASGCRAKLCRLAYAPASRHRPECGMRALYLLTR